MMESQAELNKIDVDGNHAPYSVYLDEGIYKLEQENLYRGPVWCYIGLDVEVPKAGDYKSTFVGDTPVVLARDEDGQLNAWVNRCAHKGALVCRERHGHVDDGVFTCVYHQWAYDAKGNLKGVPFRRGMKGHGGYGEDFDMQQHGLRPLRVQQIAHMVFASFDEKAPDLATFLGEKMCANINRIMHKPVKVIGYARQFMKGNWKAYSENSRDSYHGGLLHLFYPTFGIYRQGQKSIGITDNVGRHNYFNVSMPTGDVDYSQYQGEANREMSGTHQLQDTRVLDFLPEREDDVALSIQSLFPSVVLQQIQNTLATRQVLPKSVDETELVWTYFGYEDDDEEMTRHRLRNINLVGPGGFISMEDGEAVEIVQQGVHRDERENSLIEMGGNDVRDEVSPMGMDENAVRGFWKGYRQIMAR
ncbi:MAG: aromatic ring-hydroxylating dioxygenase subunit alpha [Cycloclasticus sp.]